VETKWTRIVARLGAYLTLLFLYVPLALIFLYAFNPARGQTWPPPGLTTHWFGVAWQNGEVRSALVASVEAGLGATSIALVLGSMGAFAVHRFRFFGREAISFFLVLPLALPGIVTGALLSFARSLGEFGATITFVSNIPGETETLPLAIYTFVQTPGGDAQALRLSLLAVVLSIAALIASEWLTRRSRKTEGAGDRR